MSEGQMGDRKGKGCRNNLFIINGIIFDITKSKSANPLQIKVFDYAQMFAVIDLKQVLIELFYAGVNNDTICHLYHEIRRCACP